MDCRLEPVRDDDDLYGLVVNENYRVLRWGDNIRFSYAQRGEALNAHFSANKEGLRDIKPAIMDFCDWALNVYGASMVLATIRRPSVARLINKLGFFHAFEHEGCQIWGFKNGQIL